MTKVTICYQQHGRKEWINGNGFTVKDVELRGVSTGKDLAARLGSENVRRYDPWMNEAFGEENFQDTLDKGFWYQVVPSEKAIKRYNL